MLFLLLFLPRLLLLVEEAELESKSKEVLRGILWVVEFRSTDSCTQGACMNI